MPPPSGHLPPLNNLPFPNDDPPLPEPPNDNPPSSDDTLPPSDNAPPRNTPPPPDHAPPPPHNASPPPDNTPPPPDNTPPPPDNTPPPPDNAPPPPDDDMLPPHDNVPPDDPQHHPDPLPEEWHDSLADLDLEELLRNARLPDLRRDMEFVLALREASLDDGVGLVGDALERLRNPPRHQAEFGGPDVEYGISTLVTPFRVPLRLYYVYRSKGLRGGFGVVRPMFLWYFPKYIGTKCDVLGMVQGPL
jgi:hypothetical protein